MIVIRRKFSLLLSYFRLDYINPIFHILFIEIVAAIFKIGLHETGERSVRDKRDREEIYGFRTKIFLLDEI